MSTAGAKNEQLYVTIACSYLNVKCIPTLPACDPYMKYK